MRTIKTERVFQLLIYMLVPFYLHFSFFSYAEIQQENQKITIDSDQIRHFYDLSTDQKWKDITQDLLMSPQISLAEKEAIQSFQRRIIVFKYWSDGLWIKGFISFTPQAAKNPLLILFRSGNQNFALVNPATPISNYENYTVVSSMLRGGVSEGKDEFGGKDVNDMKHLIDFLPILSEELQINLPASPLYFMGASRGALEMFLLLARYPEVQQSVTKVVALSGILDLPRQIQDRPDMKSMFENVFGLTANNEKEWLQSRNPLFTVPYLRPSLPILIVQGTADERVNLAEGHHMVQLLQQNGYRVDYWEVEGGNHTLTNRPDMMKKIAQWLEYC
jgi:predicted esterase